MESTLQLPPPTFRRYQKSRRLSVRVPEPDYDSLVTLAQDRREPPATTAIILIQAALAALPRPSPEPSDSEANRRAAQKVREHAAAEREIGETWQREADGPLTDPHHRVACRSRSAAHSEVAGRLDELAAYIEAGEDAETESELP